MYLECANAIIDVNSINYYYIIFLDNGFKYEYMPYSKNGKIYGCPDEIDNNDISRAKDHDGKDISDLKGKCFTDEEMEENIKRAKKLITSKDYPFQN